MTFQRTAYFPGQFLTDRDLTADQAYAAEKRQVQNRLLHGHGVACGLQVALSAQAGWVTVQPGLALDPYGNELRLLEELQVDLRAKMAEAMRRRGTSGFDQPAVLLALRYEERAVDPQPAFLPQTSPDAPNKPARVAEGQRLVLLLEQELDPAGRKVLHWQTDLLSEAPESDCTLTTPEVECPYVFLARVTDPGEGYLVDTSVQRPVLNQAVFFKLVREAAPYLFGGGESLVRLAAAPAPAVPPSPLHRAAQRAVSGMDLPSLQESLAAALVTAVLERLPLSRTAVDSRATGADTIGALVEGWAAIAPRLGTGAVAALREVESALTQVTRQVLGVILPSAAIYVDQVPAAGLAGALGVSQGLAQEMLAGARALAR